MGLKYYALVDGEIKVTDDILEAGRLFAIANRRIAQTRVETALGKFRVSTVFLMFDYNYSGTGPPILFETMVFQEDSADRDRSLGMERYCTLDEAVAGHKRWVGKVQRWKVCPIYGEED